MKEETTYTLWNRATDQYKDFSEGAAIEICQSADTHAGPWGEWVNVPDTQESFVSFELSQHGYDPDPSEEQKFREVGKWWNDKSINLVEKDGSVYALNGWNGESYTDSWKCSGKHNMDASTETYNVKPIYKQVGEEFELVDYEIK